MPRVFWCVCEFLLPGYALLSAFLTTFVLLRAWLPSARCRTRSSWARFGRGFPRANVFQMRQFYLTYRAKVQTVSGLFDVPFPLASILLRKIQIETAATPLAFARFALLEGMHELENHRI
jgi:hypothetical protein